MKTNSKYLILISFALISFKGLQAQTFLLGAEGELTTGSVKIANIPGSAIQAINGKNITGYKIGPYAKLGFDNIYVKPMLLVSHQSGLSQATYPDQGEVDVDVSVTKLDVPVLVGLKVIGPFSLEAGPVYNRILTSTEDFNGSTVSLRPGGFGYRIGTNAQLGIIGLNVSYQGIRNGSSGSLSSYETPNELIFGASIGF